MICHKCGQPIDSPKSSACPHCGEPVEKFTALLKTSTILISADDTDAVYRSLKEIPESLRKKLLRSTNSLSARTILIADQRGRQEIEQAMQKLPGAPPLERRVPRPTLLQITIGILLAGVSGLVAWLILSHGW